MGLACAVGTSFDSDTIVLRVTVLLAFQAPDWYAEVFSDGYQVVIDPNTACEEPVSDEQVGYCGCKSLVSVGSEKKGN